MNTVIAGSRPGRTTDGPKVRHGGIKRVVKAQSDVAPPHSPSHARGGRGPVAIARRPEASRGSVQQMVSSVLGIR